jgi:hypothetical protein
LCEIRHISYVPRSGEGKVQELGIAQKDLHDSIPPTHH